MLLVISFSFCNCNTKPEKSAPIYTDFNWGEHYLYIGMTDSAFHKFNLATQTSTDSLEKGKAYHYLGMMQRNVGDFYSAQENLTAALRVLDRQIPEQRSVVGFVFNELGNLSLDLKSFDQAVNYYDSALTIVTGNDILEVLNGKATAFQKKQKYATAIAIYDSILVLKPNNSPLLARAISNRARTKWLRDSTYPALGEYHQALQMRIDSNDSWGQNASFAHLSDYYAKPRPDSALFYASKMHAKALELNSPDDVLEAIDKLIVLNSSKTLKNYWYEEFRKLNDSIQLSRDTTRRQFALIIYDYQKSKADNLALQQRITKQRILLSGGLLATLAIISALLLWFRRRRQKLKQSAEMAIRNSQLKTSQKVHDVVANGLYKIMNELEHKNTIDKEPLLNKIEGLYEQSRDISYDHIPEINSEYDKQVHGLLTSFANDHTKVIVIGNQQPFWSKITSMQKRQLQFVLEELMINMQKHSMAKSVVVHFKLDENNGHITYKDNGIGFNANNGLGNGLKNTVSRIKSINGQVIFGKSNGEGVSIEISFPLESL